MSITAPILDDGVDVTRYILERNVDPSNIKIYGSRANLVIDRRDNVPAQKYDQSQQIMILPYGIGENNDPEDLFYNHETRTHNIAIDITSFDRKSLILAWQEVRDQLNAVRKIVNFSDSGIHDSDIWERYKLLFMTDDVDLSEAEQGIHHWVQHIELVHRSRMISPSVPTTLISGDVTINDPIDVIRYIIFVNLIPYNITAKGLALAKKDILIKARHQLPAITWGKGRQVFIRTTGTSGSNTERADPSFSFENQLFTILILIESKSREQTVTALRAVQDALKAARKLKDFSDGGRHDSDIYDKYDLLIISETDDLLESEQGIYQINQTVQLMIRAKRIPLN